MSIAKNNKILYGLQGELRFEDRAAMTWSDKILEVSTVFLNCSDRVFVVQKDSQTDLTSKRVVRVEEQNRSHTILKIILFVSTLGILPLIAWIAMKLASPSTPFIAEAPPQIAPSSPSFSSSQGASIPPQSPPPEDHSFRAVPIDLSQSSFPSRAASPSQAASILPQPDREDFALNAVPDDAVEIEPAEDPLEPLIKVIKGGDVEEAQRLIERIDEESFCKPYNGIERIGILHALVSAIEENQIAVALALIKKLSAEALSTSIGGLPLLMTILLWVHQNNQTTEAATSAAMAIINKLNGEQLSVQANCNRSTSLMVAIELSNQEIARQLSLQMVKKLSTKQLWLEDDEGVSAVQLSLSKPERAEVTRAIFSKILEELFRV